MLNRHRGGIVLFAQKLWPHIGGMETHGDNFRRHFSVHPDFPLRATITLTEQGRAVLWDEQGCHESPDLPALLKAADVVFYNSGHWITEMEAHRQAAPQACFCYRTGGNEILKAELPAPAPRRHADRQAIWARTLNATLDFLITNSAYTERRLEGLGIRTRFARFSGGTAPPRPNTSRRRPDVRVFFCAARFVPYKNHRLLVETMCELLRAGQRLELRLAGDGPLAASIHRMAADSGFPEAFVFLGKISNEEVMSELTAADYYIQFSTELQVPVAGGSYVHSEGMGRAVLEALTAGTFVVSLATGAIPEIITPDRGLLLEEASAPTLAQAITHLLARPTPLPTPANHLGWGFIFDGYTKLWRNGA
jgi:glycosyltransferase involved in cell wall biosynthesis